MSNSFSHDAINFPYLNIGTHNDESKETKNFVPSPELSEDSSHASVTHDTYSVSMTALYFWLILIPCCLLTTRTRPLVQIFLRILCQAQIHQSFRNRISHPSSVCIRNIIRMSVNCPYGRIHTRTLTANSNGKLYRAGQTTKAMENYYFQLKRRRSLTIQRSIPKFLHQLWISIVSQSFTRFQNLKYHTLRRRSATRMLRRVTFRQTSRERQTSDCHRGWKCCT